MMIACVVNLIAQFIETASTKHLNTDCAKNVRRKGFALK